jgi:hypothetical protein
MDSMHTDSGSVGMGGMGDMGMDNGISMGHTFNLLLETLPVNLDYRDSDGIDGMNISLLEVSETEPSRMFEDDVIERLVATLLNEQDSRISDTRTKLQVIRVYRYAYIE